MAPRLARWKSAPDVCEALHDVNEARLEAGFDERPMIWCSGASRRSTAAPAASTGVVAQAKTSHRHQGISLTPDQRKHLDISILSAIVQRSPPADAPRTGGVGFEPGGVTAAGTAPAE